MKVLLDPAKDMPSLDEAVALTDPRLSGVLKRAGITSVVPLMFMSRGELIDLPGISNGWARKIENMLKASKLHQRDLNEPLARFVERAFGGVGNISIAALNLVFVRYPRCVVALYAPLYSIQELLRINPTMSLIDLTGLSRDGLKEVIASVIPYGPVILKGEQIHEITSRISSLRFEAGYGIAPAPKLHVVR